MKISVVIVSFNTKKLLATCLSSLRRQGLAVEVIVVDNGSLDGSASMVKKQFPGVKLIANRQNHGFAAANNQGFAQATGDYMVMLNSDTEVPEPKRGSPSILLELAGYLGKHPETGVAAPQLRTSDGSVQRSVSWSEPTLLTTLLEYTLLNRLLYRLLPTTRYPGKLLLTRPELKKEQVVADAIGACLVFRRKLLSQIGPLDERFFVFLEETDFNRRVRQADLHIRYLPQYHLFHHWGGSVDSGGGLDVRFQYYFPSLYSYLSKYHLKTYVWAAYLTALLGSLGVTLLASLLWLPLAAVSKLSGRRLARPVANQWRLYQPVLLWHLGLRRRHQTAGR